MSKAMLGIHHITAICGDPQQNVDFYAGLLGLRLVKKTVNFDDPKTYHLYYGDGAGTPGTILTFFPWPGIGPGRTGNGQVTATSFAIPEGAIPFWIERLRRHGIRFEGPVKRFEDEVISFTDSDGLKIELITSANLDSRKAYSSGSIAAEYAIHGFYGATLSEPDSAATAALLSTLGFIPSGREGNRFRFITGEREPGSIVDVLVDPNERLGRVAGGSVHHIAWRTEDDAQQHAWLQDLEKLGYSPSPVMDRKYFHSVYFREPGGILFEIATDGPGFAIDEPADQLGSKLVLPPWLEPSRSRIEAVLPPDSIGGLGAMKNAAFVHRYLAGVQSDSPVLLLLHGTGGTEEDLIPLGQKLLPGAAILSLRGRVLENGMPRFFRRFAEGVFDLEDLRLQTAALAEFLEWARGEYSLHGRPLIAIGYSNGANIAASLMLLYPNQLAGAVLFRAMVPFRPNVLPNLTGVPIFLAAGERDHIVPKANTTELAQILERSGGNVTTNWHPGGHELGRTDMEAAQAWLAQAESEKSVSVSGRF